MQDEVDDLKFTHDDGFRHPEDRWDEPYVSWQQSHSPTIHYLHGALHLFDAKNEIIKYTWSKTDKAIVDQVREALDEDKFPLFVSEGSSESKFEKILHNAYLHKAYRSLEACANQQNAAITIFGHSLAENDRHILQLIARGRVPTVLVSMHGEPTDEWNKPLVQQADRLIAYRKETRPGSPLNVMFFDATSARVWG